MNIEDAAKFIGVPPSVLANWVWAGSGPKTVGGRRHNGVQFEQAALEQWLQENRGVTDKMIGA